MLGQACIATVGDDGKQNLKAFVALCRDDAKLGEVRAQCVDGLCALPDEQVAHAVLHEQEFERNQTVVGRVIRLETEADPSDLFHPGDREILIQWSSQIFGNIRVRVTLPADEYLAALDAHSKGRAVSVSGLIDRVGRTWVLLEPRDFAVLP